MGIGSRIRQKIRVARAAHGYSKREAKIQKTAEKHAYRESYEAARIKALKAKAQADAHHSVHRGGLLQRLAGKGGQKAPATRRVKAGYVTKRQRYTVKKGKKKVTKYRTVKVRPKYRTVRAPPPRRTPQKDADIWEFP